MTHATNSHLMPDGLRLFTRSWVPDGPVRANVLLVHGIGEHSGRYAYPASRLMMDGIAVYSYDHRGHGQSEGTRAYVDAFAEYVDDLALMALRVREETPRERPFFLMGHSLGGLIASLYVIQHQPDLDGLILSSAALQIPADLSPVLQRLSGVISRLAPKLRIKRLKPEWRSRDPKVGEAYDADPLNDTGGVRARTAAEILAATDRLRTNPEVFTMPLYLFHGTDDKVTDPGGSEWLHREAPSTDKTLELYDGLRHETLHEPERDDVLGDLVRWILAHSDPSPNP